LGLPKNLEKIGKKVDKTKWGMTPQTVNAYYSSSNNEIVFPAAILQPPFFDFKADPAVNFGGIGAVIGHEILTVLMMVVLDLMEMETLTIGGRKKTEKI
jgi:predicted metalloendopeptidase